MESHNWNSNLSVSKAHDQLLYHIVIKYNFKILCFKLFVSPAMQVRPSHCLARDFSWIRPWLCWLMQSWRASRNKKLLIHLLPFLFHASFHSAPFPVWSFRKHSFNEKGWLTSALYFTIILIKLLFPSVSEIIAYNTNY